MLVELVSGFGATEGTKAFFKRGYMKDLMDLLFWVSFNWYATGPNIFTT